MNLSCFAVWLCTIYQFRELTRREGREHTGADDPSSSNSHFLFIAIGIDEGKSKETLQMGDETLVRCRRGSDSETSGKGG